MVFSSKTGFKLTAPNLSRAMLYNLVAICVTAILVLGAVWIYSEYSHYQTSIRQMKENFVKEQKSLLKLEVENTLSYLQYKMAQTEERLRQTIKGRVCEAHAIATHLYMQHRDTLNAAQLRHMVREAIRPIRFNQQRGYFFATDLNGTEQLFADRPELEGKNMLELRGGQGEYVVRDMIDLVRDKGEGFYSYHWTKPEAEGNDHFKIAFVKHFEPFGWFFGSGEYMEDVAADIRKEVLARIERVKTRNGNYVFAGTWQGVALAGPQKGQNMIDITDINGVHIVQELIALAKGEGGFLTYTMPQFKGLRPSIKISYVVGVPEWQWYIGSGIYMDDIDAVIVRERELMWSQIKNHILKILIIQVGMILLSVFLVSKMGRTTRRQFAAFNYAFARAVECADSIDASALHWAEFKSLARSANTMLDAWKKAEQSLVKNEAKYRRLFEQTNDAVFVVEKASGRYLDANAAALSLVGYSLNELQELTTRDVSPQNLQQHLKAILNIEHALDIGEMVLKRSDNIERIIDLTAVPLDDNAVYGIARDVTETKQYIKELKETRAFLEAALNQSPAGIIIVDAPDLRIRFINPAAFSLQGDGAEKVSADNYLQHYEQLQTFLHPDGRPFSVDTLPLLRAISTGETIRGVEMITRHGSGKERWLSANAAPIRNSSGKVQAGIVIFADITERKQIEETLRISEKRHRELANSLPQTVFETDEKGRLTFVNSIAFKLFGYDRREFVQGINALEMVVPEDRDRAFSKMFDIMSGAEAKPDEYMAQRRDGTIFPITIHSNPIFQNNRIVGLRGIIFDLSEQKALESRLQQAQKMEAIGNLAGGIAHDFNNILSAVIGYTELALNDEALQGLSVAAYLKGVLKAGTRAKSLVNQILTFARRVDEELKPVNVSVVAKEVLKLLRSSIPTTIKIETEIRSKAVVLADLTQIHQIFMNLCTNAAQAMENDGGVMQVTLCDVTLTGNEKDPHVDFKAGEYLKITIRDNGKGISPKILTMIFEPYFTTKPIGEGTGLGLSVVHGIVENYGGKITVASELGQGTVFTIYLPTLPQAEEQTPEQEAILPTGNERILFVDDELSVTEVGSTILKRLGYQVTIQTDSVEALALFKAHPYDFDLVISDMTMPDLSGDKLASALVAVRPDIPIIICTGYSKKIADGTFSMAGVRAVAMKPLALKDLAETVRRVLDHTPVSHKTVDPLNGDISKAV